MKTISILLALVNSMFAGLLLAYNLSTIELHESGTLWLLTKTFAALSVIAIGALTWLTSIRAMRANPLLICGLYLVVLGAVTIVWTYHLAVLSGDMEYYMVLFGGSLMIQGLSSLLGFSSSPSSMTIT
ncbi:MAG TPA: hypothetical protein DCX53_05910 [Anaerolineae bacterium]|nr:hypothetical protein [Anaerolineae bacterium]